MIETNKKNPGTPCIRELRDRTFFVPFYQRGYRWEEMQVKQLLEDIQENTKETHKYSLQPVVVAPNKSGHGERWELIDGQQRLTTLNLILLALGEATIPFQYARHHGDIDQAIDTPSLEITQHLKNGITCKEDWEKLKENESHLDTVDNHHIVYAWLAINTWLGEPIPGDHFMKSAILCRTTVIWHEVGPENATSEFLRFNTGKIHLSPCELLKARFLATFNPPMERRSPAEIAAEWDQMESAFHDEEFWSFLNPSKHVMDAPNRIALLFELLHPSGNDDFAGKGYFDSFPKPNEVPGIEDKWLELRRCFLTLQEWFADTDIRHLVGFLRWSRPPKEGRLGELWGKFQEGRSDFRIWLRGQVLAILAPSGDTNKWKGASYDNDRDHDYLHNVLFWFNIRTQPPGTDYPFARHATVKWSLEHIYAQSSPDAAKRVQFTEWKAGSLAILEHLKKKSADRENKNQSADTTKVEELIGKIRGLTLEESAGPEKLKDITEQARHLAGDLETLLPNTIGEDLDKVWNLALLGRDENSSLSNGFFHQKRAKILDFEAKIAEHFIPPATVRVFLKAYSSGPDDLMLWSPEDRGDYKKRIGETIESITNKEASHHV